MMVRAILGTLIACFQAQPIPLTQLEHGWRSERVTATRYKNPVMGYNVGFVLHRDCDKSDRADLMEFIESEGGFVYQSGGYPCAEIFTTFKGVTDRATADAKLHDLLPKMDAFIATLKG